MTTSEKAFRAIVRFKDGSTQKYDVNGVDSVQSAHTILLSESGAASGLILINCQTELEKEVA